MSKQEDVLRRKVDEESRHPREGNRRMTTERSSEAPYIVSCPICGRGWTKADRPMAATCPDCIAKQEAAIERLRADLAKERETDKRRELSWCADGQGGGCALLAFTALTAVAVAVLIAVL